LLGAVAIGVLKSGGLSADQAVIALRILRAIVRGFVLHEMSASFMDNVDYDESYATTLSVFIHGLEALRLASDDPGSQTSKV
jgi:hypothetical protein